MSDVLSFGDSSTVQVLTTMLVLQAENFLGNLSAVIAQLVPPVINPVFPSGAVMIPPAISLAPAPGVQTYVWQAPVEPGPFDKTLDVSGLFPGAFTQAPPTLVFPAPPAPFTTPVPPAPPVNLNFDYPTVDITFPTAPPLMPISDVPVPTITYPNIDPTIPTFNVPPPSITPYIPGAFYTSQLLTDLKVTLDDRIQNGTNTGLPPAMEENLWSRARDREYRQMADAWSELDRMEVLGYAFPPGVFVDARIKIQTEFGYTVATLSRDIAIKQAELIHDDIVRAIDSSIALETQLMNYSTAFEQRALEAAKYMTDAAVAIYNSQVQAYTALLEGYKTRVAIYDAQVRLALATVDIYKAEIQAEEIKSQINVNLVNMYKTEVDALLAQVEVFKAQVQLIQVEAEVQKIVVEVFGEQVRAYTSQIQAYTAQVDAYKANVSTQGVIEDVYRAQVEAYSALVGASVKEADALIEQYRGFVQAKLMEYEGFKSLITEQSEQARAVMMANTSTSEIYRAYVAGLSSYNETLTKQWQVALDEAERVTEIGVKAAEANAQLYMTTRSLAADAAKVGAQVNAQLGAAALSAINWSTHVAYNTNHNTNQNSSISTSEITEYITSASV